MGAANEVGVDARRARPGAEVLAELREVVAARMARLATLDESRLEAAASTAVGPATAREALTLRLMDTWSHEQDIRRALGRPGHDRGPAVDTVVGWWAQFLPMLVAKRAGAPNGTVAVFAIGDREPICVTVTEGRAAAGGDVPEHPTVGLRMDAPCFAALVGGRADAPADGVDLSGDEALGRRILDSLGIMP
jgi:uncharacterized protein (TIGR03083 family)